jgi:hypothetical protein
VININGAFDVSVKGALTNNRQFNNQQSKMYFWERNQNPEANEQKTIESKITLRLTIDDIFEFARSRRRLSV